MSAIIITKGLPISLLVRLTEFDNSVNLNDGSWTYEVILRHKTERGISPFPLTITPSVDALLIDISGSETDLLSSLENDYVLVIKVSKLDDTTFIRNIIRVSVRDDL